MIAYDRSGSVIVLADGAELLVHDGPSEGPLWRRDCGSPLVALGAAAGAVIAVDRNGRARWFDARRDNIQATVEAGVPARAAAVSPAGDVLLVAADEARVLTRAGPGLVIPWPGARLVAWADDGRMLVADDAGKVGELDARGEFLRGVKLDPPIVAAAWNPQGFWVLASGSRAIRWDHEGMTHLTGSPDDQAITDVACASDGKRIALTVRDGLVIALAWPSRDTAGSLEYPERKVDGLAFGPPTLLPRPSPHHAPPTPRRSRKPPQRRATSARSSPSSPSSWWPCTHSSE